MGGPFIVVVKICDHSGSCDLSCEYPSAAWPITAVAAAACGRPALANAGASDMAPTLSAGPNWRTKASVCLKNSLPW